MAKNYIEGLTAPQLATIEEYRKRLSEEFPDIEILEARAVDGTINIRLNDASVRDYATINRTTELAIEVEDKFNVTLLPCTIPHEI